jgi:5-(carboxyamino)imidazole ribonucleotide synthase
VNHVALLGGGQLGRMLVQAAQRLGVATSVLDPDPLPPAALVGAQLIRADYLNAEALLRLAQIGDAATIEFENVPAEALHFLAQHLPTRPTAEAVAICQNRAAEKACFVACGLPCAPHWVLRQAADLLAVPPHAYPALLKTARLGYDGKGQVPVETAAALAAAWHGLGQVECVLEQRLGLAAELSVIVARGQDGQTVQLPLQRNWHHRGILSVTEAPATGLPAGLAERAIAATRSLAEHLAYVGVLCCEFFVTTQGELVANEMAPRPHNSGHYSIDACDVSQFDLQLRATLGWPLLQPRQHSAALMLNLLGDLWFSGPGHPGDGRAQAPDWPALLKLPGAHLHLYGKSEARPGRKMGHLTITAPDIGQARAIAAQAAALLGVPIPP